MVNNGSVSYDHGKDGRSSELGGCSVEIRNRDHDTYLAIRYSKGRLTVRNETLCFRWVAAVLHFQSHEISMNHKCEEQRKKHLCPLSLEASFGAALHDSRSAFVLQVMVDVDDRNEWKECIDIGGVRLPTGYFFGASAATGDLSGRQMFTPQKRKKLEFFKSCG